MSDLVMQSLMLVRQRNAENNAKWHDKKRLAAKVAMKTRIEKNKTINYKKNKEKAKAVFQGLSSVGSGKANSASLRAL